MKKNLIKQQGVALVVSLLLLLAITLLAVSNMKRTTVQEQMTGNLHDRQLALQQAEAALLVAERLLAAAPLPAGPTALINNAGIYDIPDPALPARWAPGQLVTWIGAPAMNSGTANPASYIIEYMDDWAFPPGCDRGTTRVAGCLEPTFRITARVPATPGRAEVTLQTVWRR
ncbi:PilX N-terminal domain-containing pilus assembly protein [Rheinheimera baltica]|uniref:PilX N-terminal domain-containing pilus assembly protein n=1 Tax=Rheinheimera baltica TaxID=67576 RepID=A0ABT9I0T9_9GAMM|nr:PilX N-terminal domain-containing pilus assembly protein [Rheinheimera baltica]MDP5136979.1 PilX N-terminal domain-containing pilus assembly protein [Rheinheimera baltica]